MTLKLSYFIIHIHTLAHSKNGMGGGGEGGGGL
jgi:hypothetical protein